MMAKEVGTEAQLVAEWFYEGIAQHRKGKHWETWRDVAQQSAPEDASKATRL